MAATKKSSSISPEALKTKQRRIRDGFPTDLALRAHRAISWLLRAEKSRGDYDATFIFLWIAFNAVYADDVIQPVGAGEKSSFDEFFAKIVALDKSNQIYDATWDKFAGPIRSLLDNRYVFAPFWNFHNGVPGNQGWEDRFEKTRKRLHAALKEHDTKLILLTVFDRLYVLRNQIIHGGSTWNSSVNRAQIRDGAEILAFLVPLFVNIMMDNPNKNWGAPHYPVVSA